MEYLTKVAVPESTDGSKAEHSAIMGVALAALDEVFSGRIANLPKVTRDNIDWALELDIHAEDIAEGLMALAADHNAFDSIDKLIGSYGGRALEHGALVAVAVVADSLSNDTGKPINVILDTLLR